MQAQAILNGLVSGLVPRGTLQIPIQFNRQRFDPRLETNKQTNSPLLHGNIQEEAVKDTEKSIYYAFMSFCDSSTVPNLLK